MPFETPDLLPSTTDVPRQIETDRFRIRPLTIADVDRDYDAVVESRQQLQGTFGPGHDWPPADLTLEQNRIDLAWHEKEFQRRDAFTYAVVDLEETVELGCLYVQPTRVPEYEAAVYFWVATQAVDRDLAAAIETTIRTWIAKKWPFESVAYPGRDISWSAWEPVQLDD
jgi:hypothetical protein